MSLLLFSAWRYRPGITMPHMITRQNKIATRTNGTAMTIHRTVPRPANSILTRTHHPTAWRHTVALFSEALRPLTTRWTDIGCSAAQIAPAGDGRRKIVIYPRATQSSGDAPAPPARPRWRPSCEDRNRHGAEVRSSVICSARSSDRARIATSRQRHCPARACLGWLITARMK